MSGSKVDGWAGTTSAKPRTGEMASRSKRISLLDVELFAEIFGDWNPLHFDQEFATESVFGRLIVPGGLITGILNAIVAQDLPGPGTVFLGVDWQFVKAVGIGEKITGLAKILTVRDDKPICTLETSVSNEAGEVCLVGPATTYTTGLRP